MPMLPGVLRPGCRTAAAAILFLAAYPARGEDGASQRDALVVETILRLENVDLDAKPRTKEAVLRWLAGNPGSDRFFEVVERFRIREAADALVSLAATRPADTTGVRAARVLLDLDPARLDTVIAASGRIFLLAVQISAPLLAISFLVNMAFSVLGRAAPSLNVFILSFPVQILAGLTVFSMTLGLTIQYILRDMQHLPELMLHFLR